MATSQNASIEVVVTFEDYKKIMEEHHKNMIPFPTPTAKTQTFKAITDQYPLPWEVVESEVYYPGIKDAEGRFILTCDRNSTIEIDLLRLIVEMVGK